MEELKYDGKFIQVKELTIDNHVWEKVYLPDSLVVIPITDKNEMIFIVEKRPHEVPNQRLKMVTGHIDPGETPIGCAGRELQEEAGYKANKMEELMVQHSNGTVNSNFYYFLATDLEESKLPNPDGEETILEVLKIDIEKVKEMLSTGELLWTLSTLGLFKIFDMLDKGKI